MSKFDNSVIDQKVEEKRNRAVYRRPDFQKKYKNELKLNKAKINFTLVKRPKRLALFFQLLTSATELPTRFVLRSPKSA